MFRYIVIIFGIGLIVCNNPVTTNKNYYDDLSKGTDKIVTPAENNIIDAIIKYRNSDNTDEIILISDSTIFYKLDIPPSVSKDTFPDTLVKMINQINDKQYYIGNSLLTLSNDYRYFPNSYGQGLGVYDNFWNEFYTRFPNSKLGILSISKIAINADSTMALAYVGWEYQSLGADWGVMSFKKENGIWKALIYVIMIVS